jgi:hypothetical protein
MKAQNEALQKKVDLLQSQLFQEGQNAADAGDKLDSQKRDFELRITDLNSVISSLQGQLDQTSQDNDYKDLEISRLIRETKDLTTKNASLNEKI